MRTRRSQLKELILSNLEAVEKKAAPLPHLRKLLKSMSSQEMEELYVLVTLAKLAPELEWDSLETS